MKNKIKCDVIIPVYNSPEWVKLCIYALFTNTDKNILGSVYLINDCSDSFTCNCLNNLADKYNNIKLINNKENLGFVKTVNKGLHICESKYVLLLNTDCIISSNTIKKLISHAEKNCEIGLICPVSSNAANLSLDMFNGFSYMQMDKLLEKKFSGISFDACTVVGNCLMITKKCIDTVGYLDEAYGMGYGEETDYQFKAMQCGFKAKVAIDTYVFHKSEVSFGKLKVKNESKAKNVQLFFERWGNQYNELMDNYKKNDPIKFILNNITDGDKKITHDLIIYLVGIVQNAGGVHTTIDVINYLSINGVNCNITYEIFDEYKEIMLFSPIHLYSLDNFYVKNIASTLYISTYMARKLADKLKIPLIYFSQGYEEFFDNGQNYGVTELSYKLADYILTVSNYLNNQYKQNFQIDSTVIPNGINYDILKRSKSTKINKITFILRNNVLKGDFFALDIIKRITNEFNDLEVNVLYSNDKLIFPQNKNDTVKINKKLGIFSRVEIAKILQDTDIYIDTSLTEGFGLTALEAMAAGAIPIVSNSGGINEYLKNGENGFIINEINNTQKYIDKIKLLLTDFNIVTNIRKKCMDTAKHFDYDDVIFKYINYFNTTKVKNYDFNKLSVDEQNILNDILENKYKLSIKSPKKNLLYKICRMVPKKIRIYAKKKIEKLYKFTNER